MKKLFVALFLAGNLKEMLNEEQNVYSFFDNVFSIDSDSVGWDIKVKAFAFNAFCNTYKYCGQWSTIEKILSR